VERLWAETPNIDDDDDDDDDDDGGGGDDILPI
jgi:hypothetical protein